MKCVVPTTEQSLHKNPQLPDALAIARAAAAIEGTRHAPQGGGRHHMYKDLRDRMVNSNAQLTAGHDGNEIREVKRA